MKNTFLLLNFLFLIILTSCKKEYSCTCTTTSTTTAFERYGVFHPQETNSNSYTNTYKEKKSKESVVKGQCSSGDRIQTFSISNSEPAATQTVITTCELN